MDTAEKIIVSAIALIITLPIGFYISYNIMHPCIKSHKEMVHHRAWTQYILVGKMMVPIFHDAYDALEDVCDLRK